MAGGRADEKNAKIAENETRGRRGGGNGIGIRLTAVLMVVIGGAGGILGMVVAHGSGGGRSSGDRLGRLVSGGNISFVRHGDGAGWMLLSPMRAGYPVVSDGFDLNQAGLQLSTRCACFDSCLMLAPGRSIVAFRGALLPGAARGR